MTAFHSPSRVQNGFLTLGWLKQKSRGTKQTSILLRIKPKWIATIRSLKTFQKLKFSVYAVYLSKRLGVQNKLARSQNGLGREKMKNAVFFIIFPDSREPIFMFENTIRFAKKF